MVRVTYPLVSFTLGPFRVHWSSGKILANFSDTTDTYAPVSIRTCTGFLLIIISIRRLGLLEACKAWTGRRLLHYSVVGKSCYMPRFFAFITRAKRNFQMRKITKKKGGKQNLKYSGPFVVMLNSSAGCLPYSPPCLVPCFVSCSTPFFPFCFSYYNSV